MNFSRKGFILVSIPLIVGVTIIVILAVLLHRTDQLATEESRRYQILVTSDEVVTGTYDAVRAMILFGYYNQNSSFKDAYRNAVQHTNDSLHSLQKLIPNDEANSDARDQLDHWFKLHHNGMKHVDTFYNKITAPGRGEIKPEELQYVQRQMDQFIYEEIEERKLFCKMAFGPHEDLKSEEKMWKQLILLAIVFGVVANVAVSLLIAFFFSENVVKRIKVLTDNSLRMASDMPLNPRLRGKDELAQLDSSFHQMAGALAAAARKERATLNSVADIIASIDQKLRFTAVNPASMKIWGYPSEELLGRSLADIVVEEDLDSTFNQFKQLVGTASTVAFFDSRVRHKSGDIVYTSWSVDWSPEEQSYFCVARDLTERKQLEKMKREYVAMVSHDLRSPLTSLHASFELLATGRCGQLNEKGKTVLENSEKETTRLLNLINSLLDLERLESGKMELHKTVVEIRTIVSQAVHSVNYLAEKSGIKIETDIEDLDAFADAGSLVQVMINLLANAIKFSPSDTTINVTAFETEEFLEVRVQDRGRGIPQAHLNSVFDQFQQVESADRTEKGGSGLGLAICKGIIEAHGGQIGVESEENKGCTFWWRLPNPS